MIAPINPASLVTCLGEAKRRAAVSHRPVLASWSQPCGELDPVSLFAAGQERGSLASLWAIPQQGIALIGLGRACEFLIEPGSSWKDLQDSWQQLAEAAVIVGDHRVTLCGGFAFDPAGPIHPMWQDFPVGVLTLARHFFVSKPAEVRLVINALVKGDTDCASLADHLAAEAAAITTRTPVKKIERPNLDVWAAQDIAVDDWMTKVSAAVTAIRSGELHKVVLARSQTMPVSVGLDDALRTLWSTQPEAYVFAFSRGSTCFLGATPERLINLLAGRLTTCALAGSAPRSTIPSEDERLGQNLLRSVKDRHEHGLVVEELRAALSCVCQALDIPSEPQLCKLRHLQHLLTPIRGHVAKEVQLLALLERLHPTSAVGGLPRGRALNYIRECEDLSRGWYAGPVGWIDDQGDGEFAVALRSALLRNGQAALFAGCGIVCDSQAEAEYSESEIKLRSMALALSGAVA